MVSKRLRKLYKAVAKNQARGICRGDICPCCGEPSMKGDNKDTRVDEIEVYVCKSCGMDLALSGITGEGPNYANWDAASSGAIVGGLWEPRSEEDREILPKFRVGDRVYDPKSDWPGTIAQVLTHGIYLVAPDGRRAVADESVLKDREVLFLADEDVRAYHNLLAERVPIGALVVIVQISSVLGDNHAGMRGEVISISPEGGVTIRLKKTGELIEIFPDVDTFQLLGDVIERQTPIFQFGDEADIEF